MLGPTPTTSCASMLLAGDVAGRKFWARAWCPPPFYGLAPRTASTALRTRSTTEDAAAMQWRCCDDGGRCQSNNMGGGLSSSRSRAMLWRTQASSVLWQEGALKWWQGTKAARVPIDNEGRRQDDDQEKELACGGHGIYDTSDLGHREGTPWPKTRGGGGERHGRGQRGSMAGLPLARQDYYHTTELPLEVLLPW